jgi:hypothetical protein
MVRPVCSGTPAGASDAKERMMFKRRLPDIFYNPLSVAGAVLASVSLATIIFLTFVEMMQAQAPAYIGIITYIILPVPLLAGLGLILIGVLRERGRRRKGMPASRLSIALDLNIPHHRYAVTMISTVTSIVLLFTAYGSYRVFEWTETVEFCGTQCHVVMKPEHTAYLNSPHARVKCVDCHVGSGAGWYVRSKLSGAYQVYATLADVFPRPIPTPIQNLRPAQETCEQCHWPSHFAGDKKVVNTYFRSDEANTRWTLALLMKIGGGSPDQGPPGGIHWHMNINNEVTYVATDPLRQVIPYVRARNVTTGDVEEYVAPDTDIPVDSLRARAGQRMDCIDCHNRPSHIYRPPVRIVDRSMATGRISTALPRVREIAVAALTSEYATTPGALDSIALTVRSFYNSEYPEIAQAEDTLIDRAVEELQAQFQRNIFPEMRVRWSAYPDNIGHMTDLGCFRCHDGKHVSGTGKVISRDCNSCHTILYQGQEAAPSTLTIAGLPFQHPEDIGDAWNETNCSDCHSGK